jgi:hypothetical protein
LARAAETIRASGSRVCAAVFALSVAFPLPVALGSSPDRCWPKLSTRCIVIAVWDCSRSYTVLALALALGCGGRSGFEHAEDDDAADSTRTRWTYVAAGASNTCAIATGGRLACWGANGSSQVGADCGQTSAGYPVVPVCAQPVWVGGLGAVTQVACASGGSARTCAVVDDGSVWCWGNDPGSELSAASTKNPSPVRVEGLPTCSKVSVEGTFACALSNAGEVLCWGETTVAS